MAPVKSKYGQNYEPVLRIIDWVSRPEGLNGSAAVATAPPQLAPQPIAPWAPPAKPEWSEPPVSLPDDDLPEF